jgi:hypothetical protein
MPFARHRVLFDGLGQALGLNPSSVTTKLFGQRQA